MTCAICAVPLTPATAYGDDPSPLGQALCLSCWLAWCEGDADTLDDRHAAARAAGRLTDADTEAAYDAGLMLPESIYDLEWDIETGMPVAPGTAP